MTYAWVDCASKDGAEFGADVLTWPEFEVILSRLGWRKFRREIEDPRLSYLIEYLCPACASKPTEDQS